MPAAATIMPNEITQSVDPSQLGAANAGLLPLLAEQPAEYTAVNAPEEHIPLDSTNNSAAYSASINALSALPPVPVPDLTTPVIDDDEDDDNNLLSAHRRARAKKNILRDGPMKWMPDEVIYGLKEALDDLAEANRKSKKRLLSRKNPISTTAFVSFDKDFGGFMPGEWTIRPKAKRDWIHNHMQAVLDKACGRIPATTTPAAPAGSRQGAPAAAGGNDGAADTPKVDTNDDVDDLLPPGWAVGDDEDDGEPNPQAATPRTDVSPIANAPASGLDSMMSKMSIGRRLSKIGSGLPSPIPRVALN